jgi:hypothetical protein
MRLAQPRHAVEQHFFVGRITPTVIVGIEHGKRLAMLHLDA